MPITTWVDVAARLRISWLEGVVTDAELLDAYARIVGTPQYDLGYDVVVDTTALTRAEVTHEGLRALAALVAEGTEGLHVGPHVALIAPEPRVNSLARVFTELAASARVPFEYRVFSDPVEARRWLRPG